MSGMADFGGDFHFDEGQNQFDLSLNAVAGNSASHSSPSMRNGVGGNSKLSGILFNLRHKLQTGQAHASEGSIVLPLAPLSPVLDLDEQALADGQMQPERKTRRVRLLLDSRTELTNEELEVRIFDFLSCQILTAVLARANTLYGGTGGTTSWHGAKKNGQRKR